MKNIKSYLSIIVIVLTMGYVCYISNFNPLRLGNDSGFDTSYGGGGGSSYSGTGYSSYDRDYSSGGGSSGELSNEAKIIILVIFICIVLSVVLNVIFRKKKGTSSKSSYREMTEEEVRTIIPDFNLKEFLDDRLNDFIEIQEAWQNFDYNKLREKTSATLFSQYSMQLDSLKVKNQQNIMSDFNKMDEIVLNVKDENNKYIIEVGLVISFKDYIVQDGKVVRGDKDATIIQKYKLKFIKSKEDKYEFCPRCGAKLNDDASQTCPYCRTIISRVSTKWVMSEKTSIEQETIY